MSGVLRILHHVRVLDPGGIEAFIFANLREIDRERVQFDFVLTRDQKEFYDEEAKRLGSSKFVLHCRQTQRFLKALEKSYMFYKFLKNSEYPYKIVHFESIGMDGFLDIMAAKYAKVPVRIAHSHIALDIKPDETNLGEANVRPGKLRTFLRMSKQKVIQYFVSHYATHYWACSQLASEWMFTPNVVQSGKTKIIKNPINIDRFLFNHNTRDMYRRKLGVEDRFVVGHVGRFVYSKNHEFLIDIFEEIYKKTPEAILLLIGVGPLMDKIRNRVKSKELEENVIFFGATEEVSQWMQAMDVFVFPSNYEGLGIVLLEAQAAALKCFASDMVPVEANATEYFTYLSLNQHAQEWANAISVNSEGYERKNTRKILTETGFEIKKEAKNLEDYYLALAGSIVGEH